MATLKELKQQLNLLHEQASVKKTLIENDKRYGEPTQRKIKELTEQILDLEEKITLEKKKQADEAKRQKALNDQKRKTISFEKQLIKLGKTSAGEILKRLGLTEDLEKQNETANRAREAGDIKSAKAYNLATAIKLKAIEDLKTGTFKEGQIVNDLQSELEELGEEGAAVFEKLKDSFEKFDKVIVEGGEDLENALTIEAKTLDGLESAREKLKQFSAIASSPELMGALAIGILVKGFTDVAREAIQIRKDLGLSVRESASLATKTTLLSKAFNLLGGDGEQIAAFSKAIASEFGSINQLSFKTLTNFGLISLRTGISGDNAAKLAKSIQSIQGGTLETSLNTISTFENLSRAAGVAPKLVLDDVAESTELFAKFAKDGGENLAKAAIEARKLGLNLSAVDKISESILDFESSIEKQMEASVLLGRQLNLDRARQLAIEGDLEGVLTEVKNQVGGAEALSRMNVIQRKALADAVGLEVSELSKLAAGQENVNKLSNSQFLSLAKTFGTIAAITTVLAGAVGFVTAVLPGGKFRLMRGLVGGRKGLAFGAKAGLAAGAVGAGVQSMLPKAETGGIVTKTGLAEIHKGEAISGTKNELGFGVDMTETNRLLKQSLSESKQLREQNLQLMNRLTNRVGDLALSS